MKTFFSNSSPLLFFFLLFLQSLTLNSQTFTPKIFREFEVRQSIRDGELIDLTTKFSPTDIFLQNKLEKIIALQKANENQSPDEILLIIRQTDLSLIAEKAIKALIYFKSIPPSLFYELHNLAYCQNSYVRSAICSTLAWFRNPKSISTMLLLLINKDSDDSARSQDTTIQMLSYFGVEALSAIPFIPPKLFVQYNNFFLAKIIRHFCYISMIPAGLQFLPSETEIQIIDGFPGISKNKMTVHRDTIENRIFPKDSLK